MIRRHLSAAHICLRCQIRLGQRPLQFAARRAYSTEWTANYEGNGPETSNSELKDKESQLDRDGDAVQWKPLIEKEIEKTRPTEWPPEPQDGDTVQWKPSIKREIEKTRPTEWPPEPQDGIKRKGYFKDKGSKKGTKRLHGIGLKVYGRTGSKQYGDNMILPGVGSLGKTAEVLVLRESKMDFYKPKPKPKEIIDEAPTPESIDILATLQSERGIISSEDVKANINAFKPKDKEIQTWDDFNNLVQSLQTSFTSPQLRNYIRSYPKRMEKAPSLGVGVIFDTEAISRVTPWIPEISPISESIGQSPLRGYSLSSYNLKQNLAVRVLRECWSLEVSELVEGIGEVEFQVEIRDLAFLTSQGFIESLIKRYYLNEPEKIEIYRPRQVIRITSTREKSALIIAEIQDGVSSISRDEIQLKELCPSHLLRGWKSRIVTPLVLTKLGELTKTDIRSLPDQELNLLISSMITKRSSGLSERADVVRRLLLDLARYDGNTQRSRKVGLRDFNELPHKIDLPGGFVRYPGSRELSWHERLRTWSRWTTATPKSTDENKLPNNVQYTFPFDVEGLGKRLSGSRQENSDPEGAEFLWSHEYTSTTLIKAGTILHNIRSHRIGKSFDNDEEPTRGPPTISPDKTLNMDKLNAEQDNGSLRIFSSQAQNFSGLFQSDHIECYSEKATQELVMHFKPNPWACYPRSNGEPIGPAAFDHFPSIEMSFSIDPTSLEVKFRDLHAVVSTETADLMLPELKADLQFERKIRSRMLFNDDNLDGGFDGLKNSAKSVKDFIENSQLDLTSDRQLETPPKLVLDLAKHLCSQAGWERTHDMPGSGTVVEYLFSKLEYRKSATYNFHNHELCATSIEAGKAGGSRLELSLSCRSAPNQEEFNETMDKALEMIRLMDMKNITSVYGQVREVETERKGPVLGPDDFKYVPKRPSDFLEVKKHYEVEEEKMERFEKKSGKE